MSDLDLSKIATLAQQAAENVQEVDSLDAEEALVKAFLDVTAPGLRPTKRLQVSWSSHNCNGNCSHPDKTTYSDVRGISIASVNNGSRERNGTTIDRELVYYTGQPGAPFVLAHRVGSTTQCQEGTNEWHLVSATHDGAALRPATIREVLADGWSAEKLIEGMTEVLQKRADEGGKQRQADLDRLARLEAAAKVLRGG